MGESALVSHMKGKKHEEYVKNVQSNEKTTKISDFFSSSASTSMAQQTGNHQQQSTETSQIVTVTCPTKQASQSIQSLLGSNATLKAEICWTLKVITSHYSLKSCEDISSIFKFMFPDSETANILLVGKEKQHIWQPLGLHLIFSHC